jgi:hypothetical protein
MEAIISDLLSRFEQGALTRRGLIQGLAMLTAASGGASVAPAQDAAMKGLKIDHMSIQVTDLPRAVAFGFMSEDKPNEIVRLGGALWSRSITRVPPAWWITSPSVCRTSTKNA